MNLGVLYDIDRLKSTPDYAGNYAVVAWRIFFSACPLETTRDSYMPRELRQCDILHGDINPRVFCIALRGCKSCAGDFLRPHMSSLSLPGLMPQDERVVTWDESHIPQLSPAASIGIIGQFILEDGSLVWLFVEAAKRKLACRISPATVRDWTHAFFDPRMSEDELRVIIDALDPEALFSTAEAFHPFAALIKDNPDLSRFSTLFRKLVLARHDALAQMSSDKEIYEEGRRLLLKYTEPTTLGREGLTETLGGKASTGRCPKCGFTYKWDGKNCGHCGYPTKPKV